MEKAVVVLETTGKKVEVFGKEVPVFWDETGAFGKMGGASDEETVAFGGRGDKGKIRFNTTGGSRLHTYALYKFWNIYSYSMPARIM